MCTAAVLCGGKSKRMGFDKVFLKNENNELLLLYNATKLTQYFNNVLLISNSYDKLQGTNGLNAFSILIDETPEIGPLGGICTALKKIKCNWLFVMACDMPSANFDLIKQMQSLCSGAQVVLCQHSGGQEPLFAFYHKSCLPVFEKQIFQKSFRLSAEFAKLKVNSINISEHQAKKSFVNLNTKQDIEKWKNNAERETNKYG